MCVCVCVYVCTCVQSISLFTFAVPDTMISNLFRATVTQLIQINTGMADCVCVCYRLHKPCVSLQHVFTTVVYIRVAI